MLTLWKSTGLCTCDLSLYFTKEKNKPFPEIIEDIYFKKEVVIGSIVFISFSSPGEDHVSPPAQLRSALVPWPNQCGRDSVCHFDQKL